MKIEEKLSEMIKIKTVSSENGPNIFLEFTSLLKSLYPNVFSKCEVNNLDGCLVIKWKGKNESDPILFMNHHDVVNASEENWLNPPFSGMIDEKRIWGRGALDTKGGLAAMLEAAERLIEEGFTPASNIYFVSDSEEETTGNNASKCADMLHKQGVRFRFVLDEGGMIVHEPISGAKAHHAMIGVGEKGCCDMKFIARSKGGHASTPPKNTPWIRLAKFMSKVERSNLFEIKLTSTLMEMFRSLSKSMSGFKKILLSHPVLFKPLINLVVPRLSPETNAFFRTTICFTKGEGSDAYNVIPPVAYVSGNMRFSHHEGIERSLEEIKRIADKYDIEIQIVDKGIESPISDYRAKEYELLCDAIKSVYKDVIPTPYVMTGASDSRFFKIVSDNIYRFIPFVISDEQLSSIHGDNECVDIDSLNKAVEVYRYLMER